MHEAEDRLGQKEPKPAAEDQDAAIKHLAQSQSDLAAATEALLVELRTELQQEIVAALTEMHEVQVALREATEAEAPRAATQSRTALIALAALGQREGELVQKTEDLHALTTETQFGIALPTALRLIASQMRDVQKRLAAGDATLPTVTLERRIEDDLLGLLQAMKRLPPTTPPPPGTPLPSGPRERERELNRLVAELKMIRLLQVRLNDDTTMTDKSRDASAARLSSALKRQIEALGVTQEEIRDTLRQIDQRMEGDL
jgi:hypothetical protein